MTTLGEEFVAAIAKRDRDGMRSLLAEDVDLKGLTPSRLWEGTSPDDVDDIVFGHWFEEDEVITAVSHVETGEVAGVERVGYRFEMDTPLGPRVVEQQVYYKVREGRIVHLRLVCSGFRVR
jgi:ketosteroid isomerase-like protein